MGKGKAQLDQAVGDDFHFHSEKSSKRDKAVEISSRKFPQREFAEKSDVLADRESALDQALSGLLQKRSVSVRETALSKIVDTLRKHALLEFVEKKFLELMHPCLNSFKKGSAKEKALACEAMALLALNAGFGDNAVTLLNESWPALEEALSPSPSEITVHCLAIVTFVGGRGHREKTERTMRLLCQYLLKPDFMCWPSSELVRSIVDAWSFLLTGMDKLAMKSNKSQDWMFDLRDLVHWRDEIAVGEAVALMVEMGGCDGKKKSHLYLDEFKEFVVYEMREELSPGGRNRNITRYATVRSDLSSEKLRCKAILDYLKDGICAGTVTKINDEEFRTRTWRQTIQVEFLKGFLRGGFCNHMVDNVMLQDVLGFVPQRPKILSGFERLAIYEENASVRKERKGKWNKGREAQLKAKGFDFEREEQNYV